MSTLTKLARKIIFLNNGKTIGKPIDKYYNGKKIKHVTLEYFEKNKNDKVRKAKYLTLPKQFYEQAKKENKWTPINTTLNAKYNNKRIRQQTYEGRYKPEEIKKYVQNLSNKLATRGQQGKISIAVQFFGQYRNGGLTNFGDNVKVFNPDEYNWEEAIPEYMDGFSIYMI